MRDGLVPIDRYCSSSGVEHCGVGFAPIDASSGMFNVRISEEQYAALQELAHERHLPVSTMARAWLLDRLDHERHAS